LKRGQTWSSVVGQKWLKLVRKWQKMVNLVENGRLWLKIVDPSEKKQSILVNFNCRNSTGLFAEILFFRR
jgi:hypothetical protein